MRKVPIKNIYYIILYAWDRVKDKSVILPKGIEEIDSMNDVLLDLFLNEVEELTRKSLRREYVSNVHQSRFIKGKINISETIRQTNQMIVSEYDEFDLNHELNQILKTYLQKLYYVDTSQKKRIRRLLINFESVETIEITFNMLKRIIYNRLNVEYRFPIEIGGLLYEQAIPSEIGGALSFYEIMEDEEVMSNLFENFIFNYYRFHYPEFVVGRRIYRWNLKPIGNSNYGLIPTMNTDVEVETPTTKIIIDAKYYRSAFTKNHEKKSFRSDNMYQIKAYMNKQSSTEKQIKGILMYPSNHYEFDEQFHDEDGNILAFKTINLEKNWESIKNDLAEIFIDYVE